MSIWFSRFAAWKFFFLSFLFGIILFGRCVMSSNKIMMSAPCQKHTKIVWLFFVVVKSEKKSRLTLYSVFKIILNRYTICTNRIWTLSIEFTTSSSIVNTAVWFDFCALCMQITYIYTRTRKIPFVIPKICSEITFEHLANIDPETERDRARWKYKEIVITVKIICFFKFNGILPIKQSEHAGNIQ